MKKMELSASALVVTTVLSACGGGGGSSPQTAPLTLRVTDSPIDPELIDAVCIRFTRITVHYAGQDEVTLDYNPLPSQVGPTTHCMTGTVWNGQSPVPPVRLSALGGPLTVALAESLQVPVGRVTWIRLHFATGSYVIETIGGQHPLACPSCEPTDNNAGRGFKLNRTFEVESGGLALTVDIDLLKSLHEDSTGYVLRPTARIENTAELGTIAGRVDEGLIPSNQGTMARTSKPAAPCTSTTGHDAMIDDHHRGLDRRFLGARPLQRIARRLWIRGGCAAGLDLTRSRSLAMRTIHWPPRSVAQCDSRGRIHAGAERRRGRGPDNDRGLRAVTRLAGFANTCGFQIALRVAV